jgi:hypothetical protein
MSTQPVRRMSTQPAGHTSTQPAGRMSTQPVILSPRRRISSKAERLVASQEALRCVPNDKRVTR